MQSIFGYSLSLLLVLLLIPGCIGTRQTQAVPPVTPPITLSNEQIHSPSGDMSARLPYNWVMLDAQQIESPQVFAVACNPEYTLSVIFSEIPIDNTMKSRFSRDGVGGLIDLSFERRMRRSNGRATTIGDVEEFAIGKRRFSAYSYTTDTSKTMTRVAIFYTARNLYECAITELTFSDHPLPDIPTLTYIHQLILGGVDWE